MAANFRRSVDVVALGPRHDAVRVVRGRVGLRSDVVLARRGELVRRPGQSGAPVLAYYAGGSVPMQDGSTAIFTGPVEQFVGVYSGRISDQSDLGFVWKAAVVSEIVEQGGTRQRLEAYLGWAAGRRRR